MDDPSPDDLAKLVRLRALLREGMAKHIRVSNGVSLRHAERITGVPRQTLQAWEDERWTPRRRVDGALRYLDLLDRLMAGGRDAA